MKTRLLIVVAMSFFLKMGVVAQPVVIEWVVVGNPNNPADSLNSGTVPGIGSVPYEFRISTTEVTIGQYAEFLNAVADADANGLYHSSMGTDGNSGNIIQSGSSGSFTYAVQGGDDPNLPVTFVDWYDTLRFANWMQNGQMNTGMQTASTTEDGAYTFTGTTTVGARNSGAEFYLPSENEWYKAAYHQPSAQDGPSDDYWLYPMQTNNVPYSDNPLSLNTPDDTRSGNFLAHDGSFINGYNDGFAVSGTNTYSSSRLYSTPVGIYELATSYYGAFDMGGNVREWDETTTGSHRGVRGGSWLGEIIGLQSTNRDSEFPGYEFNNLGFRLAGVFPEPDSDNDGLSDQAEATLGTNPNDPDSDNDGLTDGQEVLTYGTNPNLADTDLDGFNDLAEIQAGKDPLDINDTPDAVVNIYVAVEFEFFSQLGQDYQVQWSENLADWFTLPEVIAGTGDAIIRFYSTRTEPRRYFRAEKL